MSSQAVYDCHYRQVLANDRTLGELSVHCVAPLLHVRASCGPDKSLAVFLQGTAPRACRSVLDAMSICSRKHLQCKSTHSLTRWTPEMPRRGPHPARFTQPASASSSFMLHLSPPGHSAPSPCGGTNTVLDTPVPCVASNPTGQWVVGRQK